MKLWIRLVLFAFVLLMLFGTTYGDLADQQNSKKGTHSTRSHKPRGVHGYVVY